MDRRNADASDRKRSTTTCRRVHPTLGLGRHQQRRIALYGHAVLERPAKRSRLQGSILGLEKDVTGRTDYNYGEFKQHLCSNPKWIRRGLFVVAHSPEIATPKNIDAILEYIKMIDHYGTFGPASVPLEKTLPAQVVRTHAYEIYKFYRNRKRFVEPKKTS